MNILLVNPWITDFAAYDFWARPLGLLTAGGILRERGHELALVDCLDRFHQGSGVDPKSDNRRHNTGKFHREVISKPSLLTHVPRYFSRYGMPVDTFRSLVAAIPRPDVALFTCIMTYWYPGAAEAIRIVRELLPGTPIILGGIYATLCPDHARRACGADAAVTGSVPAAIVAAAERLGGAAGNGLVTPDHLDAWPSPPWDLYGTLPAATVLTTRGCPLRCTVCASRLLFDGFQRRDPLAAAGEIEALAARGVEDIAFCDDALLLDWARHGAPLFGKLAAAGAPARLHTPNGLHVRAVTPEVARTLKAAGMATVRLSLETVSGARTGDFSGKMSRGEFERAADALFGAGFAADDLGAYVLAGLPGQTMAEVEDTIAFSHRCGIPVRPALFSPVPGTAEHARAVAAGMIAPDADPILHNNTLRSVDWFPDGEAGYRRFKRELESANRTLVS